MPVFITRKVHKPGRIAYGVLFSMLLFGAGMSHAFTCCAAEDSSKPSDTADTVSQLDVSPIELTDDEISYRKAHPTLTVVIDTSWIPFEYYDGETQSYRGILPDFFRHVGALTGLRVEFQANESYSASIESFRSGNADALSGVADDLREAEAVNCILSKPYLSITASIITQKSKLDIYNKSKKFTVALVKGDYSNKLVIDRMPNSTFIECETTEECFKIVQAKKADFAIVASYAADYYILNALYDTFHSHMLSEFEFKLCLGIKKNSDPRLVSIINKAISKLTPLDINSLVYNNIINTSHIDDWRLLIRRHPLIVIGGTLSLCLLFGLLLFLLGYNDRLAKENLLREGERFRLAISAAPLCVWELDLHKRCITSVANAHHRHGFYDLRENIPEGLLTAGYVHPEDIELFQQTFRDVSEGKQGCECCWRIKDPQTGEYWWEHVVFHIIYDSKGRSVRAIGLSEDVTEQKDAQKDLLTGLCTRKGFERQTYFILRERRQGNQICAFIILDLDNFKGINDTYGYRAGDQTLAAVGIQLTKLFRRSDVLGRLGGDEFIVLMSDVRSEQDVENKAALICKKIAKISAEYDFPFPVSCSVGYSLSKPPHGDLKTLYVQADTALYCAKRHGKGRYARFTDTEKDSVLDVTSQVSVSM